MKIEITNVRGISQASVETAKITLIAGLNGSGKTSFLQAVGAATTGCVMPLEGVNKNQAGVMVHAGTASGEIVVDTAVGEIRLTYPDAKRVTTGAPLEISDHAAGLYSIVDDDVKMRAKIVSTVLKAEPTRGDLQIHLAKIGGTAELVDAVWQTISAQGWDAAHKQAQEKGTKMKGQWEGLTQERYGARKADGWIPKEWEAELALFTEQQLADALKQDQEWLEAAISDQAVGDAEVARLRGLADGQQARKDSAESLSKALQALWTNESQIRNAAAKLPPAEQPKSIPCPHCGQALAISGATITVPQMLTAAEIEARAKALADVAASLQEIKAEIERVNAEHRDATSKALEAEKAAADLAKLATRFQGASEHASVEDCRARVMRAQNRLAAKQKQAQATSLHTKIGQNVKINELLAPDGMRLTKLKDALSEFNAKLALYCQAAGWRPVAIKPDMSISYGGSQYPMLSGSEQYRCRVALQVAIAGVDGSMLLIIDRADILDAPGRNGLLSLLNSLDKPSIIGMTINRERGTGRPMVPDLSGIGGVSYYLDNGVATKCQ
jgi:hypothetical protein